MCFAALSDGQHHGFSQRQLSREPQLLRLPAGWDRPGTCDGRRCKPGLLLRRASGGGACSALQAKVAHALGKGAGLHERDPVVQEGTMLLSRMYVGGGGGSTPRRSGS